MKWENLREEEFKGAIEKSGGLCIVPLGCTEVHGEHLPVGADYYQGKTVAERAAEQEYAVVFPTGFWLGDIGGAHADKDPIAKGVAGQISLSPELRMLALTELCGEIARNGFRKILILNNHGGNVPLLNYFIRSYAYERRDHAVMWTGAHEGTSEPANVWREYNEHPELFPYLTDEDKKVLAHFAETGCGGGHADIRETAKLLDIVPEYVRLDRCTATSGLSTHRADYLENEGIRGDFNWPSNFPNMYCGFHPIGATPNIGRAMNDVAVRRLVRIFKMLKEDEDCVRMAKDLPKL